MMEFNEEMLMFAYKEILTLDDPKTLVLAKPLPLRKG